MITGNAKKKIVDDRPIAVYHPVKDVVKKQFIDTIGAFVNSCL